MAVSLKKKICQLEPEGRVKVELVLCAAEALLACCLEDQKPEILAQLKDIKAQWEETVTYMTHCHSRIEWVWLHWSEYLLARDEFYRWFQKMLETLEPHVELQLGLKEKQWQLSHAQVLLHNVDNQAILLDRLLEEAASLFNRIGDPSVDEDAQKRMKAEYDAVRVKAQDRVDLLQEVTREHAQYQAGVDEFQLWLRALVEKVDGCLGRACKLTTQHRLSALQDIAKELPRGEGSLRRLEEQSVGVIRNTSPLGAEKITEELEELRKVLEKLRVLCAEEEERLQKVLKSKGACERQIAQLEAELREFRKRLQRLADEGLQPGAKAGTEDELVACWRLCVATRVALAAEEPQVDRLQAQLKELLVFSHDLQPLSDSVVTALQEYQSMKGRNTRLCNTTGVELWQRFQRPLQDLQLWKALAQKLLDVTSSLPDLPSIHTFLPQIEDLLERSRQSVQEHGAFSHELLELRQWVSMLTQKLEAHQGDAGPWGTEAREAEVERLLVELPEMEAKLPLVEARGRLVMEKSSPEGAAVVQEQLGELAESWRALRLLEERLLRWAAAWSWALPRQHPARRGELSRGSESKGLGFCQSDWDPVPGNPAQEDAGSHDDFSQLLRDFEQWLQVENSKLVRIIATKTATAKDVRARDTKLQELEARVPEGQHLFESLLCLRPARGTSDELEDLRYRWMLYKSKLKDSSHLLTLSPPGELAGFRKTQQWRGLGAFFRKVCCVALPVQLLLLLLLLLLFLLPVGEEARSCTLANNFARSFKLMLRYDGPPPT
ncbi:nesprin-3 [Orycteropus afer afer]|uniref:Nesprin-3 n=1 Tax=Orycteropus afer afer TaxID=1230840 RepID=A0A8B7A465_ORYAF|nr:nesprin-3 [Orycteropus afer afer]